MPLRAQDLPTLTLSLPASNDSVPLAYAADQNLFNDFGLELQLRAFEDLRERDSQLLFGAIDGLVSDLTSILSLINRGVPLSITSTAYENVDGALRYALVTHFFSGLTSIEDVYNRVPAGNNQKIGLNRNTDFEYALDLLTEASGFTVDESTYYRDNGDIIQLATIVAAGGLDTGVFAEPIPSYMEAITGAENVEVPTSVISDFSDQVLPPSIVSFQTSEIEQNSTLIENFYAGYNEVINEFANTPRELIVDAALEAALQFFFPGLNVADLPPGASGFLDSYQIPEFPAPRVLLQSEYDPVNSWAASKNIISSNIPFGTVYNDQFID